MRRLLAIALVVAAVVGVRLIGASGAIEPPTTALALGFTLILALVTGEFLRRFRLPRLTGYLLFGVLIGPYLGNVITGPMAGQLQTINGIATALIAFIAGLTLNFERLGRRISGIARMIAATLGVAMIGSVRGRVARLAVAAGRTRRHRPGQAGDGRAGRDHRRQFLADDDGGGHFGNRRARPAERPGAGDGRARRPRHPGAVLPGDAAGARRVRATAQAERQRSGPAARGKSAARWPSACSSARCSRSTCGTSAARSRWCCWRVRGAEPGRRDAALQPLLAALAAGMVIQNLAVPQGDTLKVAIQRGAPPVLVVFFVAVGASLRLDAVAATGLDRRVRPVGGAPRIRSGLAWRRACACPASIRQPARLRVDRPDLAGRHHARTRVGRRQRSFRPGASACRCLLVGVDRD